MGILIIGIVTIPFYFEKNRKIMKTLKGVEEMRKNVDSLLIINNESICDVYADSELSIKDAFKAADNILCNAAKSISELVTIEGSINLDFRDVETTMREGGGAIMAIGRARGGRRVEKAIVNALESPLFYGSDISNAKKILFNIYTSEDKPLFVSEMREIDAFMYGLNPNIDVIWGTSDCPMTSMKIASRSITIRSLLNSIVSLCCRKAQRRRKPGTYRKKQRRLPGLLMLP